MKDDFLTRFRLVNVKRAETIFHTYNNAGPEYMALAACGECGEIANLVKKAWRKRIGGPNIGHSVKIGSDFKEKLIDEIGGTLIYLDLLSSMYDLSLEEIITITFNRVSDELNTDLKL